MSDAIVLRADRWVDVIAVPGDPSEDITTTRDVRFVMKEGRIHKHG